VTIPHAPGRPWGPPPPPPRLITRIPGNLPFVVRPNGLKRGLVIFLVLLLPVIVLAGVMSTRYDVDTTGWALLGVTMLALVLLFGGELWSNVRGGPMLALAPDGLWIRTRPTRRQAVWLPWEGIAAISRQSRGLEKLLVVQPQDPRTHRTPDGQLTIDPALFKALLGANPVASLRFADKPKEEILAAVHHFSAGRCPIA